MIARTCEIWENSVLVSSGHLERETDRDVLRETDSRPLGDALLLDFCGCFCVVVLTNQIDWQAIPSDAAPNAAAPAAEEEKKIVAIGPGNCARAPVDTSAPTTVARAHVLADSSAPSFVTEYYC